MAKITSLLTLMLKTQLRSEQRHREMEAIHFDTFIGPANTTFLNQMTEQTQAYNTQAKGKKDHDLGPPHV